MDNFCAVIGFQCVFACFRLQCLLVCVVVYIYGMDFFGYDFKSVIDSEKSYHVLCDDNFDIRVAQLHNTFKRFR